MDAQSDFDRARRRAALAKLLSRLRREPDDVGVILPLDEVVDALGRAGERHLGLQVIALDTIVGTVNRARDFDRGFRPTSPRVRERWERIAAAVRRGDFTLKSGKRSSWFLDAKQTTCRPEGMLLVAEAALAVLPADVDVVLVHDAARPLASPALVRRVVDAVRAGHLCRAVARPVVDDEPLHLIHPGDRARKPGERPRQLVLLVLAGDLDDELHGTAGGYREPSTPSAGSSTSRT